MDVDHGDLEHFVSGLPPGWLDRLRAIAVGRPAGVQGWRCAALALLVAVTVLGCSERRPNVLLVVLDTTRADAVGVYDGGPAHTPTLDWLASEGTVYTRARATAPWTVPAHGSLFTGLYPSRHGAHSEHLTLPSEQLTLAEILAPTYATAGFSENPHIVVAQGFAQGFEHFAEVWRMQRESPVPPDSVDLIASWLEDWDPSEPFFVFVNLMTPHLPYDPPEELRKLFITGELSPESLALYEGFGERHARRYNARVLPVSATDRAVLRALYLAEVAEVDIRLGRILDLLRDRRILDDTLIVAVGDHGENIADHGLMEHQFCLYETLLRVPMILRFPGVIPSANRVASPVQLVDVAPTVLEAVGLAEDQRPQMEGRSLLSGELPPERPIYAEYMKPLRQRVRFALFAPEFDFSRFDRRLKSIQVGDLKLIDSETGSAELYDLASDPGEHTNLASQRPEDVERLRTQLRAWSGDWAPPGGASGPEVDEATRRALRALGYLE